MLHHLLPVGHFGVHSLVLLKLVLQVPNDDLNVLTSVLLGHLPTNVLQTRVKLLIFVSELVDLDVLLQQLRIQIFLRLLGLLHGHPLQRFRRDERVLRAVQVQGAVGLGA